MNGARPTCGEALAAAEKMDDVSKQAAEWKELSDAWVWISHATVGPGDLDRLAAVERLTVWNVRFPVGLLAQLRRLWWLDVRGGSASDLSILDGCTGLRGLAINQVRGLTDVDVISQMHQLELLSLYGLARLEELPRLDVLPRLRRVELGQLRPLRGWAPLARVPALEELFLPEQA
jgi:hypothetical protein